MALQHRGAFFAGVGCTLATLLALAAGLLALSHCAGRVLRRSSFGPKYRDNEHYRLALHYERSQQSDAAVSEWKAFDADGWREIATRPLAELLAKQGKYAEALEVIDRNGASVSWGEYIDLRAPAGAMAGRRGRRGVVAQARRQGADFAVLAGGARVVPPGRRPAA